MGTRTNLSAIEPTVLRYLERVRGEMPVAEAYLFGSHLRGEAREESDIDLAIISPALSESRFENNVRLGMLTWDVDTRIEPLVYRPEDFSENSIMPCEIIHTGIRIYPETEAADTQQAEH